MSLAAAEVLQPADAAAAAECVLAAAAAGRTLLPCGRRSRLRRHLPEAAPDQWLSFEAMDRILSVEPVDLVCEVEAGVSPAALQAALAEHSVELTALCPGARQGTLGGLFLAPDHSLLHAVWGSPREQVLGGRWILADGTAVRTGARVVKSVAGYDLTRLFLGSRGRLAACTALILRLRPVPRAPRWYRSEPEQLKRWLMEHPGRRPPLRVAFSVDGPRDPVWVQTDGLKLPRAYWMHEEAPEAAQAARDRALEAFRKATHRMALVPGQRDAHKAWRNYATNADAFDWLAAVGSFSPRTPREEEGLRERAGVRVLPLREESPWLEPLARACAPGAPPFGGRQA